MISLRGAGLGDRQDGLPSVEPVSTTASTVRRGMRNQRRPAEPGDVDLRPDDIRPPLPPGRGRLEGPAFSAKNGVHLQRRWLAVPVVASTPKTRRDPVTAALVAFTG